MNKAVLWAMICLLPVLSACNDDQEGIEILFFNQGFGHQTSEDDVLQAVNEMIPDVTDEEMSIIFHPAVPEKFYLEIAAHQGDLIIADEHLLEAVVDPQGLLPIDHIIPEDSAEIPEEPYRQEDPDTGELKYYAVPLTENMPFVEQLGVDMEEQVAAFIPVYTNDDELAAQILKEIISMEAE